MKDGRPRIEGRELIDWAEEFVRKNVKIQEAFLLSPR